MKYMWFMEMANLHAKAMVFSEEVMQEYLESEYSVTAKYQIELVDGSDYLPSYIGDE